MVIVLLFHHAGKLPVFYLKQSDYLLIISYLLAQVPVLFVLAPGFFFSQTKKVLFIELSPAAVSYRLESNKLHIVSTSKLKGEYKLPCWVY